jgi:hypothetical protein
VHASYTHEFTDRYRGMVLLDVFNLMNQQKAIDVDQDYRLDVGDLAQSPVNPLFGTGKFFQYPTTVRIGFKFQF